MIHLITSKDNQICYLTVLQNNLTNPPKIRYWFQIYSILDIISLDDQETSTNKFIFNYYTNNNLSECIKNISSSITTKHAEMKKRPEDKQEEEVIISACERHINSEVIQYLEAYTINIDLTVESIYSLLKIPDYNNIINTTKRILNITDIELDKLSSLSYALYKVLDRGK